MRVIPAAIPDVLIIEPEVFEDARGFFYESFNQSGFQEATGLNVTFVQDNHSHSKEGVLRGLHYQLPPAAQGKLIRVVRGAIFDVAVDIRKSSPTFGKWISETLSADNRRQLWVPEGFAHGFLTLDNFSECIYKTTSYYAPEHECCIAWNDPEIGITWPDMSSPILSTKDQRGLDLAQARVFLE
ncbi:dTDP-4-dehydrorhamnose 3,5-epimerase [Sedimenticola hydrogenitrophicus]|uniref:dTDP-4-dehydrorhamnose 3,5-epimerase n=1 Tax=Sedimenticola hydrogenitrophicus TaxID=2967975 RepID=UPI0023B1C824|nr:dTDP-4-dehydrorhamnose 3,5-epimerase [Sedimenticola hydrogenitrophicus]